jgi:hypothetical protein
LPDHLSAEDALPADLRRAPAEEVHVELFQVENVEKVLNGGGHLAVSMAGPANEAGPEGQVKALELACVDPC